MTEKDPVVVADVQDIQHLHATRDHLNNYFQNECQPLFDKFTKLIESSPLPAEFLNSYSQVLADFNVKAQNFIQSSVQIAIIGASSTGKSTLCNRLVDDKLLPTAKGFCTSSPFYIFSGESPLRNADQVKPTFYFGDNARKVRDFQPNTTLSTEMQKTYDAYKTEVTQLLDSTATNSTTAVLERSLFGELCFPPVEFRGIITRIELQHPIMGITTPGVCLSDSPGFGESDRLGHTGKMASRQAQVIIYMFSAGRTNMEDIEFLKRQHLNGSQLLFLFNCQGESEKDSRFAIEQMEKKINDSEIFRNRRVYAVNILSDEVFEDTAVSEQTIRISYARLRRILFGLISAPAKRLYSQFAAGLYQQVQITYLMLCTIINSSVRKDEHSSWDILHIHKLFNATELENQKKRIEHDITKLDQFGKLKVDEMKYEFKTKYYEMVEDMKDGLKVFAKREFLFRDENGQVLSLDDKEKFAEHKQAFRTQLLAALQERFQANFNLQMLDWIDQKSRKFEDEMHQRASAVVMQIQSLRLDLVRIYVPSNIQRLHENVENKFSDYTSAKVAGVLVGAGGTGGLIAFCLFSGAVMLVPMVGIAVAGTGTALILTSLLLQKLRHTHNEKDERSYVVDEFIRSREHVRKEVLEELALSATSGCTQIREYLRLGLHLNLLPLKNLCSEIKVSLENDALFKFIYLRNDLSVHIKRLLSYLEGKQASGILALVAQMQQILDAEKDNKDNKDVNVTEKDRDNKDATDIKTLPSSGRGASCAVCLKNFNNCAHMCPTCHIKIGKCPTCNRGHYLVDEIRSSIPRPQDMSIAAQNQQSPLLGLIGETRAVINYNKECIQEYVDWFKSSQEQGANSKEIMASLKHFVGKLISTVLSFGSGSVHERKVVEMCLESLPQELYTDIFAKFQSERKADDEFVDGIFTQLKNIHQDVPDFVASDKTVCSILQQISTQSYVHKKLQCFLDCVERLDQLFKDNKQTMGSDQLMPSLVYVVANAKVPGIKSEVLFVNEMMDGLMQASKPEEFVLCTFGVITEGAPYLLNNR